MPLPSRLSRSRPGSGAALGVTMAVANVLSYVFVLILSRALGPSDFGGFSALSAYGIVLSVPAGALQVIVARHVAGAPPHSRGLRTALVVGVALAAATIIAAPLLADAFRLDTTWSAVWLGLTLVPMTLTGAFQGILLGRNRLAALSAVYVATAAGRLAAGAGGAALGLTVAQVFLLLLLVAVGVAALGAALCRSDLTLDDDRRLGTELVRATMSLGAFIALTNVDVTLARAYLDDHDSGGYALAATFGRAMGWGTQFVALLLVPRMQGAGAARSFRRSLGLILGLGVAGVAVIAVAPSFWIRLAGGAEYAEFGPLAIACVALGVLWALVQVSLFAEMGLDSPWLGRFTWIVLALQSAVIVLWFHDTPYELVTVCAIGAAVIVAAALVRSRNLGRA
ncbi:hypothetical protein H9L21_09095 [Aeromicrobium senzhongii]|uniref:Polysaccharide biosynthesis protein n=1 Tax=Aeromicrobium senzhongii TaxID=2663859 RepID=A0ABX6SPI9_9ACTN|nr:hypothetical protein [Aeromicrobium senzhongii]MTB86876.1 hypothetical protein [Aeromicrobium senzhongii]QNL93289.1 hypothetical protein H9L21_09095 [Aeromicrobium senzhongii]